MEQIKEAFFVGKLGKNPELKYTKTQKAVCYLSVAVNDKKTNQTRWEKVKVWEKQAELANLYLKKGSDVFVQGRINKVSFVGTDGKTKSYNEVNASLIGFSNLE
ncbi:MAG: single-stranded DNA-binding protein [Bacteriovoracaceae bacterium]|jgi:single-strand DNA-binding protein|nr:single-stranded DNA-binding protein [Bacteriovoracaceae bacterium]